MKSHSLPAAPHPNRRRAPGFSLVELTMSLGLVGFAMVAIVGLIPVGLDATKAARRDTVVAEIFKTIAGAAQVTDYSKLGDLASRTWYFSNEGMPIAESDAGRVYRATLARRNGVRIPDGTGEGASLAPLDALTVEIVQDLGSGIAPRSIATRTIFVANQGR